MSARDGAARAATRSASQKRTACGSASCPSSRAPASRRCATCPRSTPRSTATTSSTSNYVHIGIAVGTERGLVVPVLRDAERLSLRRASSARSAASPGARATASSRSTTSRGGTFTISNGGVFGSLLSTPILNPPQSGILGMHKIEKRPVVVDDQVVDPADDVRGALLRPPPHRRRARRSPSSCASRSAIEDPDAPAARTSDGRADTRYDLVVIGAGPGRLRRRHPRRAARPARRLRREGRRRSAAPA